MRSVVVIALAMVVLGCGVEATEEQPVAQAAQQNGIAGTVLETLDVSNYTYVRMETPAGEALTPPRMTSARPICMSCT